VELLQLVRPSIRQTSAHALAILLSFRFSMLLQQVAPSCLSYLHLLELAQWLIQSLSFHLQLEGQTT